MLVENAGLFVLLLLFAFLFIWDSGRRDICPFRKTNNSIPWDEVFETLKRKTESIGFPFLFRNRSLGLTVNSFFFNSCFLTGKSTQVVQFSATNFTHFVHFDAVDSR